MSIAGDARFAEDLQLAEVVLYSSRADRRCEICGQATPTAESIQQGNCGHGFCAPCFYVFASGVVAAGGREIRCPLDHCGKVLDVAGVFDELRLPSRDPGMATVLEGIVDGGVVEGADFYCVICMETVPLWSSFGVSGCGHMFCTSCVGQHIAAKVEENSIPVRCPAPDCKEGELNPDSCQDFISQEVFQRWGRALCEAMLPGSSKFYCPFPDCSALLLNGGELEAGSSNAVVGTAVCPHCNRTVCTRCHVPWHEGVSCTEYAKLGEDEKGKEDLMVKKMANKEHWQRCPQCRMYVQRAEGCVYIVCRCGFRFCYLCASPMTKGNHHCAKCNRTY